MRNFFAALLLVFVGTVPALRQKQTPIPRDQHSIVLAPQPADKVRQHEPKLDNAGSTAVKIIAMVPNPRLTGLGLEFDRWIDSLQGAAAAEGFNFEKQWVPWVLKSPDYSKPGWLFFREKDGDRALKIFLVAESPISGVNEDQIKLALSESATNLIGVVGPAFSGGFRSLNTALSKSKNVKIITGSATSHGTNTFCHGCTFDRTVDPDDIAKAAFQEYLTKRNIVSPYRAELDETDTTYGSEDAKTLGETASLHFPRDISAVRGAYEQNQQLQKAIEQEAQTTTAHPSVALVGEAPTNGPGSVPIQSSVGTAATEDLEMQEISQRLHQGHFRLASLRATNPLDSVFLRQYFAARNPDLQFYLLEPDILFTHPPEVNAFRGTLAVSRYSLLAKDERPMLVFPSKASEGVFWATRSVITRKFLVTQDPLWLSIIGIDGYWPVAKLTTDPAKYAGSSCAPIDNKVDFLINPTKPYITLWLSAGLAVLFVAAALTRGEVLVQNEPQSAPRKWYADFFFNPLAPLVFARRYHAFCLVVGLSAILLLLSQPLAEAWNPAVYLTVLPAAPALWVCCPLRRRLPLAPISEQPTARLDCQLTPWMTTAVVVAVLAMLWFLSFKVLSNQNNDWSHFAAYRAVHLGNGVNPLLPLLLTGFSLVCCAWYHFQRFIFASERFVPLDLTDFGTLLGPYERVRDILARYATGPAMISAVVAAGLVVGITQLYNSALTIEGGSYDRAVVIVLASSAFFTVLSVCQFLQAWWNFSDFLVALQGLPIRHVFFKLPRELGSVALFSVAPRERSYLYLLRARDCLRKISCLPEGMAQDVETAMTALLARAGADKRETSTEARTANASFLRANSFILSYLQRQVWCKGDSELPELAATREPNVALAEEFIALRFLSFIRYATLQLRNLLTYFSVGFILQVMAVSSYPFFSRSLSKLFILITFSILSTAAGYVLWGMGRDTTLRSLATDNKGSDHPIALQTLQSASLPLLAFASTYFPDLGNVLFGWIGAALELGK